MPLLDSTYRAPSIYHPDISTIYYGAFKKVPPADYTRETFNTPDDDFLDIDWLIPESPIDSIVVIVHGFEGSSQSASVLRFAHYFYRNGWKVAALNLKGCSGRPNRLIRSYHSGASYLIDWAIEEIARKNPSAPLYLIGLSLGGNILLNYLGSGGVHTSVKASVAVSVPCDLAASEQKIWSHLWHLYTFDFLKSLKSKAREKNVLYPGILDMVAIENCRRIAEFDDCCTAPINGYSGVSEYYRKASSKQRISAIHTPTLLVTAKDDPFLCESCLPFEEAAISNKFFLETPDRGGHVAFPSTDLWLQRRALDFFLTIT